eukprot:Lithocolla_globosa_v1_NODE_1243_length_2745_cov_6.244610.p2 type:complete len:169 gc:universal NODE_1243_length_2745_cov_6.244610:90-596(+)
MIKTDYLFIIFVASQAFCPHLRCRIEWRAHLLCRPLGIGSVLEGRVDEIGQNQLPVALLPLLTGPDEGLWPDIPVDDAPPVKLIQRGKHRFHQRSKGGFRIFLSLHQRENVFLNIDPLMYFTNDHDLCVVFKHIVHLKDSVRALKRFHHSDFINQIVFVVIQINGLLF